MSRSRRRRTRSFPYGFNKLFNLFRSGGGGAEVIVDFFNEVHYNGSILGAHLRAVRATRLTAEGKAELESVKDNNEEIEYRFGAELEFGTAGKGGGLGYGTNLRAVRAVNLVAVILLGIVRRGNHNSRNGF